MSFDGIAFPYQSYSVQGGIRKHIHEYPHNPGGAPEKLGRKLYEIHVTVNFTDGLIAPQYEDLFSRLAKLRDLFEFQTTAPLLIPHIGTIQACADSWRDTAQARNRSMIAAELVFFEDLASAFLVDTVITSQTVTSALADMNSEALLAMQRKLNDKHLSLFSQINDLANTVLGILDQVNLYGSLVVSKIDSLTALLQQADTEVNELNDPDFYPLLDALHNLWFANVQLNRDILGKGALATYMTPMRMWIGAVAAAVYHGDSSRAAELLQLNAIEDPLDIAAGTAIIYYKQIV